MVASLQSNLCKFAITFLVLQHTYANFFDDCAWFSATIADFYHPSKRKLHIMLCLWQKIDSKQKRLFRQSNDPIYTDTLENWANYVDFFVSGHNLPNLDDTSHLDGSICLTRHWLRAMILQIISQIYIKFARHLQKMKLIPCFSKLKTSVLWTNGASGSHAPHSASLTTPPITHNNSRISWWQ